MPLVACLSLRSSLFFSSPIPSFVFRLPSLTFSGRHPAPSLPRFCLFYISLFSPNFSTSPSLSVSPHDHLPLSSLRDGGCFPRTHTTKRQKIDPPSPAGSNPARPARGAQELSPCRSTATLPAPNSAAAAAAGAQCHAHAAAAPGSDEAGTVSCCAFAKCEFGSMTHHLDAMFRR